MKCKILQQPNIIRPLQFELIVYLSQTKMATSRNPHDYSWQQTMLRIKDPKVSVPFYQQHFGFTLIHK